MLRYAKGLVIGAGLICSYALKGQATAQKVTAIRIIGMSGAEDVVGKCSDGATKGLNSVGYSVVDLGRIRPGTPIVHLVLDDIYVSGTQGLGFQTVNWNAYVPVAAAGWEVGDEKYSGLYLTTGNGNSHVADICEAAAKTLVIGPDAVNKQQAAQRDANVAAAVGLLGAIAGALSPSTANAPKVPAFPPQAAPVWLDPSEAELKRVLNPEDVPTMEKIIGNLRRAFATGDRNLLQAQIDPVRNVGARYPHGCSTGENRQPCLAARAITQLVSRITLVYTIGHAS